MYACSIRARIIYYYEQDIRSHTVIEVPINLAPHRSQKLVYIQPPHVVFRCMNMKVYDFQFILPLNTCAKSDGAKVDNCKTSMKKLLNR